MSLTSLNAQFVAALLAASVWVPAAASAQTQETPGQSESQAREGVSPAPQVGARDSVAQTPLLKDWEIRKDLFERGISLTGHVILEPSINAQGYRGSGLAYAQQIDLGAVFDLKKMGIANDGTVRLLFSDRVGRGLQTDKTGAYIQDQAYFGQGQNFRFDELSYERSFIDKRLSLKGGFYSMGNDFGGLPYVCNFSNNGACGHPLGLLYGSGWTDSPTGQWGGRVKWTDFSGWYIETGLYDVTPLRKQKRNGFNVDFDDTTGAIAPIEIGYVRGKSPQELESTYKIGVYYDTSQTEDLADPKHRIDGRSGGYVQVAQEIWKARDGSPKSLGFFGVATLNDPQTGLFRTSYEAGASWRGAVPGRDNDITSVGWVQLNINPRLRLYEEALGKAGQTNEQLVEVNYGVQATPWLLVRPSFQYVIQPSGYEARPDSFVFTLHVQATL